MNELRNLAGGDQRLIGDIIGDSFSDDPVNRWVFGGQEGMTAHYTSVAKKLYLPKGFGHVTQEGTGVAMWLPPGIKKDVPLWRSIDMAYSMIRHNGVGSIMRGLSVDYCLDQAKPLQPHYYLFAVGARQGCQGKGIGGELMRAGLERVDTDGMPAYLESSKEDNIEFYRHFGFDVLEKVVPAHDCPPLWLMWREAS